MGGRKHEFNSGESLMGSTGSAVEEALNRRPDSIFPHTYGLLTVSGFLHGRRSNACV